MTHITLKRFVEFSRRMAPAKHQKPFKKDLEKWALTLSDEELVKLGAKLSEGQHLKYKYWTPIARQMLELFYKKGA